MTIVYISTRRAAIWAGRRLLAAMPTLHEVRVWETPHYCASVLAADL